MGFRLTIGILLFLVACDLVLTVVRPTADGDIDVSVLDYVLVAAHSVVVLAEGGCVFQLWSGTVLFTAGLLGELLETATATVILLFFRLLCLILWWVVRRYASSGLLGDSDFNMFLYVADQLIAVSTWCSLMYTAGALTEKRMYAPYHREHVELPQDVFREQRRRMQDFEIQRQAVAIEEQQRELERLQRQHQQQQQQFGGSASVGASSAHEMRPLGVATAAPPGVELDSGTH